MVKGEGVMKVKGSKEIKKKFKSKKLYDNELMIYKKRLPYVAKMISHNDKTMTITLKNECCFTYKELPQKDRKQYHQLIRNAYRKLKKDTGFYHHDFHGGNIIITPNNKIKLIDFAQIGKDKKKVLAQHEKKFFDEINLK